VEIRALEQALPTARTGQQEQRLIRRLGEVLGRRAQLLEEIRTYAPEYEALLRGSTLAFDEVRALLNR
jgi:hypothetical protein